MTSSILFRDRRDAGRRLAAKLKQYANQPNVMVLALPRGGVPVAYEVAKALNAPLDLFLVRKLGTPGHEELALGAIASGGVLDLNQDIIRALNIPNYLIEQISNQEYQELTRREQLYRAGLPPLDMRGKTVILVDDGLATGSSMRAAVSALRQLRPARIVVAVPVASEETCDAFRDLVDEIICAVTPMPFFAVGSWYEDFSQTTDEEVIDLLHRAALNSPLHREIK
ncbi:MAG TPA: phosphoribosyltransferase [Anaerolineae bacterium]|nr:phosphoribosyltransferase [Anaerolineae bacterium]